MMLDYCDQDQSRKRDKTKKAKKGKKYSQDEDKSEAEDSGDDDGSKSAKMFSQMQKQHLDRLGKGEMAEYGSEGDEGVNEEVVDQGLDEDGSFEGVH